MFNEDCEFFRVDFLFIILIRHSDLVCDVIRHYEIVRIVCMSNLMDTSFL